MIIALDARPLVTRHASGAVQHARNILAQWAAKNVDHHFVLVLDQQTARNPTAEKSFMAGLGERFALKVVPERFSPTTLFAPSQSLPAISPKTLGVLNIDVFHSFTPSLPRACTAPMVMTIHDLSCELDLSVRRTPQARLDRAANRRAVRRAHHIVAVSTQTRNDIVNIYAAPSSRVRIIFNGINPIFKPESEPELRHRIRQKFSIQGRYVLMVGSDIPRRNYPRIFHAMLRVWQTYPELKLLFAGHNHWSDTDIFKRAAMAGVLPHLMFVESPSDVELAQLYRDALVTCCGSSFEGFGLSVLEAMACGCPVACSDMTSLREVAGKAVMFFAHDDPDSIYHTLISLLADSEYRRQLGQRGILQAAGFTWSAAADQLLEILNQSRQTAFPEVPQKLDQ